MVVHTCECCHFSTNITRTFNNHLNSNRHIKHFSGNQDINFYACAVCSKKYESRMGLWHHNQKCKEPPPIPPHPPTEIPENILLLERIVNLENKINQNKKVISTEPEQIQYIYLIQEREFTKTGEPIYKIGKTKQENLTRFKQYSKGSRMLCQLISKDCDEDERILLGKFRNSYVPRKDVGSEYFEGDYEKMIQDIHETIFKK